MAVVLRLKRRGSAHKPFYSIVAADKRFARDKRYLEEIGVYNPLGKTELAVNADRALHWIKMGAQQSDTVKKLLRRAGVNAKQST